jgi:hypothetical protein
MTELRRGCCILTRFDSRGVPECNSHSKRPLPAYSVEKLGFGAWAKNLPRHGEIRSRRAEGLPAERARLT